MDNQPRTITDPKELARKANDRIRVFNPTSEDHTTYWDGLGFIIPNKDRDMGYGKGEMVLPRYVALNYIKQMADKIIGLKIVKEIKKVNDERTSRGLPALNHWEERPVMESRLTIQENNQRAQVIKTLWLGVEEEYGMVEAAAPEQPRMRITSDEDILASLEHPVQRAEKPLSGLNTFQLQKLAREKGIKVDKSSKKEELLQAISQ